MAKKTKQPPAIEELEKFAKILKLSGGPYLMRKVMGPRLAKQAKQASK